MNDVNKLLDFTVVWQAVVRRKVAFFLTMIGVLVISVFGVSTIPSVYRAESNVLIERQVAADLISTTVTGNIQERLEVIQQKALTETNLLQIARELELIPQKEEGKEEDTNLSEDEEIVISEILANLSIEFIDVKVTESRSGRSSNVVVSFIVAYESEDPKIAAQAANRITELLLEENKVVRSRKSSEIASFLDNAQTRLKDEIQSIEKEVASLREENYEFLPEQLEDSRKEISDRKDEVINLDGEIGFLTTRINQLKAKLDATPKHLVSDKTTSAALQDPAIRLQQAKLDLALLRQSFTESHPDVVQTKELIKSLEAQVKSGGASNDLTLATNPEFIALAQQLNEAEAELESTKARREQVQEMINTMYSKFSANPSVELRYNQLLRDLDRAQKEYSGMKSRLYGAELAKSLELEEKGERFTWLSRAAPPRDPARPNRLALYILSLVASCLAGGTRVFLAEIMDSTIRTTRDMVAITGAPPIGIIPAIEADS